MGEQLEFGMSTFRAAHSRRQRGGKKPILEHTVVSSTCPSGPVPVEEGRWSPEVVETVAPGWAGGREDTKHMHATPSSL